MGEIGEIQLEEVQVLEGHDDRVWSVAWSPSGSLLASCSGDKSVRIWARERDGDSTSQWVCKAILEETHTRTIRSCEWSPCGNLLATASFDNTVGIWQLSHGDFECLASLEGHESEVKSVAWNASGNLLGTCSRDKSVWVWEAPIGGGSDFECLAVLNGHTQDVKMLTWHPSEDSNWLVSASYDNTIKVWGDDGDMDDWSCLQTLDSDNGGHSSTVWAISFDASGKRMVSSSDDLTLKIWDTSLPPSSTSASSPGWRHLTTVSGFHSRTIFSTHWSKINGLIATGAADDCLRIFEVDDHELALKGGRGVGDSQAAAVKMVAKKEKAHSTDINCVQWHPKDGGILATAGDDEVIRMWRVKGISFPESNLSTESTNGTAE